jgi:4-methylaminobutanoate oxidase (formaldehyde-forming)
VLVLDPEPMLHHAEIVRRDGEPVGYVRAGSYGHTLGGAVGLAMLPANLDGAWTVEIADRVYPAKVIHRPLYDPTSSRVRQ